MNRKRKRLVIFSLLLLSSVVVLALGLKYFPFTKVVRMPAVSEQELAGKERTGALAPHTLYFDFEVAPGKDTPAGFYKGLAHSGQYSVKAFGQNSFSAVVERTAGEIGTENLKAVALSAWVYVFPTKNDVKGNFVFTASSEVGVNVCWHGVTVAEPEVPKGVWFKISGYFDLSGVEFKPGYKLQVYFWNNSSTDILVDDYFIAFGGAVDRRGDSARVDMTRPGGFTPAFNMPPFPVTYLERVPLAETPDPAGIGADDFTLAGDFLDAGANQLLVVRKDGKASLYAYCAGDDKFRKIVPENQAALSAVAPVKKIMKGKFLSGGAGQFIIAGDKKWLLGTFEAPGKICSGKGDPAARIRVIQVSENAGASLIAGDFNGDRRTEILAVKTDGTWNVMSFGPPDGRDGYWKVMVTGDSGPVAEWKQDRFETGISAGKFLPGNACDVVLTVNREIPGGKCTWTLRRLDLAAGAWKPLFPVSAGFAGKTIGPDTLRPEDTFLSIKNDAGKQVIYRYSREWRFDLKEIRFNDTTFVILSSVDFHGYEKDRNPKYYESLVLVPGYFSGPRQISLFVAGHVDPSRGYQSALPDFTALYSLPENP